MIQDVTCLCDVSDGQSNTLKHFGIYICSATSVIRQKISCANFLIDQFLNGFDMADNGHVPPQDCKTHDVAVTARCTSI